MNEQQLYSILRETINRKIQLRQRPLHIPFISLVKTTSLPQAQLFNLILKLSNQHKILIRQGLNDLLIYIIK